MPDLSSRPSGHGERLAEIGAVPSIGTIGNSFDCPGRDGERILQVRVDLRTGPATDPGKPSKTSNWPPWAGCCTGTTPGACTATSTTYHPRSSKPRSTLQNGPTRPWSKSNSPSLHQNQGDSYVLSDCGFVFRPRRPADAVDNGYSSAVLKIGQQISVRWNVVKSVGAAPK